MHYNRISFQTFDKVAVSAQLKIPSSATKE